MDKFQQALNDITQDYSGLLRFWKSGVPSYEYEELKKQVDENISTLQELINEFDMLLDTNNQLEKENIKLEKSLNYLLNYLDKKYLLDDEKSFSRYLYKELLEEDIRRMLEREKQ